MVQLKDYWYTKPNAVLKSKIIFTDANSVAAGFVYNFGHITREITSYFTEELHKFPIHLKEAIAVYLAIKHAKNELKRKKIIILCDNISIV